MTAIDTKIIPLNSITGTVLNYGYGNVAVVLGVYIQNGQVLGLLLEDVPEVTQEEVCPNCKYVEYLKNCLEKPVNSPTTKNPFMDHGGSI